MGNTTTEGLLLYASMVENFRKLKKTNPEWALEYISALIDYSFDGELYSGENMMIELLMNSEMPMIDNQRIRYGKASKGGKAVKVTDEEIINILESQEYSNLTKASNDIAIYSSDGKFSRQALSNRLEKMGYSSLEDFYQKSATNLRNPQVTANNTKITGNLSASKKTVTVNNPTNTSTPTSTSNSTLTDTQIINSCNDARENKIFQLIKNKVSVQELEQAIAELYPELAEWQIENKKQELVKKFREVQ